MDTTWNNTGGKYGKNNIISDF